MASSTTSPTCLKLLIDPKSNTLLFAEAEKDFVDFLFNIMSLPVANVVTLLGKQGTAGCTGNIYDSIENLGNSYMLSAAKKDVLLKPMIANYDTNVAFLLPKPKSSFQTSFYTRQCHKYNSYVTFLNPTEGGFVKEPTAFIVTDDLVVRPMSTESIIGLFNKFNISDMSGLEVKVVSVGDNEGVELLRALMQSKTVLTDVFLAGKKEPFVESEAI